MIRQRARISLALAHVEQSRCSYRGPDHYHWLAMAGDVAIALATIALVGGSIYYLLAQNAWPASEAEAVELGGHLTTIEDQAENDWDVRCLWWPAAVLTDPPRVGPYSDWVDFAHYKVYQLEYRTSLFATNSWTSFGAPTAGGGSTNWVVELGSGERERYYRVRELP